MKKAQKKAENFIIHIKSGIFFIFLGALVWVVNWFYPIAPWVMVFLAGLVSGGGLKTVIDLILLNKALKQND